MQFVHDAEEKPPSGKRFGKDLTNAYFFTTPNTKNNYNNKIQPQGKKIFKKVNILNSQEPGNSKPNVTRKRSSKNLKHHINESCIQKPTSSLVKLLRKYVNLKNYNKTDKRKYEVEFKNVCVQLQAKDNIGKFPLSNTFIDDNKPLKLNKQQRQAQRKNIIMAIQSDLQIMINGRKKDEENIRTKTSTYWTTDEEGDYVYHDKTTKAMISHTEFYNRYCQSIFVTKTTKTKIPENMETLKQQMDNHQEKSLPPPPSKLNLKNFAIKNHVKEAVVDNNDKTTTVELSILDKQLIKAVKEEYTASLEDAERDCWSIIKDAMEKYEEKCAALKENMEKQMELIHSHKNIEGNNCIKIHFDSKSTVYTRTPEQFKISSERKNKNNLVTPQSSSSSTSCSSLSSSSPDNSIFSKATTSATTTGVIVNHGNEESNTFQALAKSTLDIKNNRKKKEKLRRRSIVSLPKKRLNREDRRKSLATNSNILKNHLNHLHDDSEDDDTPFDEEFQNYSDSSDSDW
jgi:hypothetical protein